jgi:hypothetical protein
MWEIGFWRETGCLGWAGYRILFFMVVLVVVMLEGGRRVGAR